MKATPGELCFARRLESLLDDDWLWFHNVPVGKQRLFPDFILVHPQRGLLVLEVKDWKLSSIKRIGHDRVELENAGGLQTKVNPLKQAHEGALQTRDMLQCDPHLKEKRGKYKGNLICPWGYGVVLTNITRKEIRESMVPDDGFERVLPGHLLICQDEMLEDTDPDKFQKRLWGMFKYRFKRPLTQSDLKRIRWHLYPEIRIDNLEQLARGLGDGHRVIHGVAGSGKTLILEFRSEVLAQLLNKPILVLCYNITLAAKLRSHMRSKGIADKVLVYHFHDWCGEQLKAHQVDVAEGDKPYWERQVDSVIAGVEKGKIPREQYGAVLIDEGHDFEEDWLRLAVQMVDRNTNSLLLLYDDAQSIYRRSGLGFSLSSVGVQARGRTTMLKHNHRNTRQILNLAYEFAKELLQENNADDDHVPLVKPQAAGVTGLMPKLRQFGSSKKEARFAADCVAKWRDDGVPLREMAIIYDRHWMGKAVAKKFRQRGIPFQLLSEKKNREGFNPGGDQVVLVTRESSKGLEFSRVILVGLGRLPAEPEKVAEETRLLYVAMTRARECLLMTASETNLYTQRIESITRAETPSSSNPL
ncbi:MAG: NERD domain-containing protein [Deltaproteobacteria bacterium]|nr:NERD domain-containing protein [Deltaproteobacteria bacterium]